MESSEYIFNEIEKYIGKEKLSTIEKGYKFLCWSLYYLFDKTDNEVECDDLEEGVLISDGSNDGGIDAAFTENDGLHIMQTKYGSSHCYEEILGFLDDIKVFIEEPVKNFWNDRTVKIHNQFEKENNIFFYYITNESILINEYNKIEKRIQEIEEQINKVTVKDNISIKILDINSISDFIDERTSMVPRIFKGKKFEIIAEKYFINKENNTVISEVALKHLAKFIEKSKKYVFYSNIRNYLGKNNVNKVVAQTYRDNPKNFWYYNNGITIVCDNFKEKAKSDIDGWAKIEIETPQIVNGCQTASTIYTEWERESSDVKNNKEGTILVKIIKDTNGKRNEITRYTNNQTAVTGKDFYSLEEFHQKLKKSFQDLGYNYEIQRKDKVKKSKGNLKYKYLFDNKFKNAFFAKDVVQAFAAGIHFKPAKARTVNNLVPGGTYYDKLFNDDNTSQDPRFYLFPYAVMYYSKYNLQHNKTPKWKSANLLYVSIYFKMLLKVFIKLGVVSSETNDLVSCDESIIEYIDKIMISEKMNVNLLKRAENILKSFFKDSKIKDDKINDNLPRFLKSAIENDSEVLQILNYKIDDELFDEDEGINLDSIKIILDR